MYIGMFNSLLLVPEEDVNPVHVSGIQADGVGTLRLHILQQTKQTQRL